MKLHINVIRIWYHDYAWKLYRKQRLRSRIMCPIIEIVGVIALIIWDNVTF